MRHYVFEPLGLKQTQSIDTPQIPEPVLHTFDSGRRGTLGIKPGTPFYEESTFWDPSWTTANGAVQVTDITDFATSMEAVGTGRVLSRESFQAQVGPNLAGFGHKDPACPVCMPNEKDGFNYGLGVVNLGPWITQTKSFAGCAASVGYLPSKKLTIAVAATYTPQGFDAQGNYKDTVGIFAALAQALAPHTLPALPPGR
jgi:CubicO group peptidase (beta-lactamase class C family)